MTKTKANAIILSAYRALPDIHVGFRLIIQDTLLDECEAAERQHRRGRPAVRGFSTRDAARYFVVKYLRDYMLKPSSKPNLEDYLHIRRECFLAASIVQNHGAKLVSWVKSVPAEFDSVDYVDLMQ